MSQITKGERIELKSVVRQQFKVLRAEVEQRQAEMDAEIEQQIAERFSDADLAWQAVLHKLGEIVSEANRSYNDALYESGYQTKGHTEMMWVSARRPMRDEESKADLRRLAHSQLQARLKAAKLRLDRDEADLLKQLAVGALETDEAHAFLGRIPSVGELVPAARLAELERRLGP